MKTQNEPQITNKCDRNISVPNRASPYKVGCIYQRYPREKVNKSYKRICGGAAGQETPSTEGRKNSDINRCH